LEEADIQKVLDTHSADVTEEESEDMTVLSEQEVEDSDTAVEMHQLTTRALKKSFQMANNVVISMMLTVGARNLSIRGRLSYSIQGNVLGCA
jgi:hypothetical protein